MSRISTEDSNLKTGSLKGAVIDSQTGAAIVSASIIILGTTRGAVSDSVGQFRLSDLPVGSYTVAVSCVGYESLTKTDIIIRAGRTTVLDAKMLARPTQIKGIKVSAGYFPDSPVQPTSTTNFSFEEIHRSPGSAGDISRVIFGLPSIAKVNDLINNLIVRGGNPKENAVYIDNIEYPNINHFPLFGTTGGPIGMINIDLINEVNFSAGGCSAALGDCLSSVMQLDFREGNRDEVDMQADLNIAGYGLVGEGPIAGGRGSWLFSGRLSFLDLVADLMNETVVPRYSDYQGKMVLDLSPRHRISLIGIWGDDYVNFEGYDNFRGVYVSEGWVDCFQFGSGLTWRYLWSRNGYSNNSASYSSNKTTNEFQRSGGETERINEKISGERVKLRNVNFLRISSHHEFEAGFELKYLLNDYNLAYFRYFDFFGRPMPPFALKRRF